ncbi:unnamed protein product [Triticum turgidum subsp. durum]|uniref:Uncharacterized protein n=1 Tax=Triticum turgidum subsp. durum TaxID=4567 RepID=A0A9R1S915_TRITD|nr:unnamed protein product [Triticum turgidum subsp. durum]
MMNFTEDAPVKKGSVLLTRMESITAYKNQRGQPKSATPEQSDIPVSANDMCSLAEWPSHARRNQAGGQKKKGRGVLKGFKASKKRFANGSAKLNITFSKKLGGTVGMNYRSFKDDVVVIMKRKLPLIGVRTWSDIHPTIHRLIVANIIRNLETGEEPDCIALWELTHTNNGTWSNTDSQKVYDQALEEVKNKEAETEGPLSKRINLERAEREQLEERLKEERAERERLLQEERTSRLKFEKNMMAKFVELSKQMETQQVPTKRVDKENSNPNLQNILSQTSSPNKTPGSTPTAISSNALIQAVARQSRMYKAMEL